MTTNNGVAHAQAKVCGDCKESLPTTEFYRSTKAKDGLQDRCKACGRKRMAAFKGRDVLSHEERAKRRIDVANAIAAGEPVIDVAFRYGTTPSTAAQWASWSGVDMLGMHKAAYSRPRSLVEKEIEEKVRAGLRNREIVKSVRLANHKSIAVVRDKVGIPEPPLPPPERKLKVLNRKQVLIGERNRGGQTEFTIEVLHDLVNTTDTLTTIGERRGCSRERVRQIMALAIVIGWKIEDRRIGYDASADTSLLNGSVH